MTDQCCEKEPDFEITYDCGTDADQTLLVCKDHYKKENWNRFAIQVKVLAK